MQILIIKLVCTKYTSSFRSSFDRFGSCAYIWHAENLRWMLLGACPGPVSLRRGLFAIKFCFGSQLRSVRIFCVGYKSAWLNTYNDWLGSLPNIGDHWCGLFWEAIWDVMDNITCPCLRRGLQVALLRQNIWRPVHLRDPHSNQVQVWNRQLRVVLLQVTAIGPVVVRNML